NDVLDMGKIESGNIELEELVFDLEDMIISLTKTYEFLSKEANLNFNLELNLDGGSIIKGDQYRLQQILRNLLSNAFKFTGRGEVSMLIEKLENDSPDIIKGSDLTLLFEVTDTGKGISKDRLETIFNAFEQEDASITREFGGSGLGLAIVSRFCELMGGSISVTSKLGQGSTFKILLPFSRSTKEDIELLYQSKADITEKTMVSGKILVAEDNEVNAIISRGYLEAMGHSVTVVENGQLALEAVKRGDQIDAILMDIHMPVMDGVEATKEIRKLPQGRDVPIIAVTAEAIRDRVKVFLESGMDEVLTKPFTEIQLMRILLGIFGSEEDAGPSDITNKSSSSQPIEDFDIGDKKQMASFIAKVPKDRAEKLLRSAEDNLKTKMEDLWSGVNNSDVEAIKLASHTIRGSSGSLYAMRVSEIARIIQEEYQDIDKVRSLMPLIDDAATETIRWWKSI
ncbi:MAG: response regulator, partial [Kordiimonadaceae bacterium]|nr:response regulator [Kordiimonadaceae bacterium]